MRLAESNLSDRIEATSNVITSRDRSSQPLLDATFALPSTNTTSKSRHDNVKAEVLRARLSRAAEARSRIAELESLSSSRDDDGRQHLLNLAREEFELEMQAVHRIEESLLLSGRHHDRVAEGTIERTNDASEQVGVLNRRLQENEKDLMAVTLRLERSRRNDTTLKRHTNNPTTTVVENKEKRRIFTQIQDVRERVSKWREDRVRRVDTVERVLRKQKQDEDDLFLSTADISSITSASSETSHVDTTARRLEYITSSSSSSLSQRSLRRVVEKLLRQREAKQRAMLSSKKSVYFFFLLEHFIHNNILKPIILVIRIRNCNRSKTFRRKLGEFVRAFGSSSKRSYYTCCVFESFTSVCAMCDFLHV